MRLTWSATAIALVALVLAAPAARAAGPGEQVLEDPRYGFCHDDAYPLTPDEHAYCGLAAPSDACPSLARACERPPIDPGDAPLQSRLRGAARARRAARDDHAEGTPRRDEASKPEPPASPPGDARVTTTADVSGLARILLVVLLVAFLVAVVRAVAGNFLRDGRDGGEDGAPPPDQGPRAAEDHAPRGPVETDVDRLLARARDAAARGAFGQAIDDTYAALLRRLDGDGLIDLHPSRTNGDHVRKLADRPELRDAVRDVVREVEGVQFGGAAPSEARFREVIDRVAPLVGRALVAALAFVGLSAALSCAPHLTATDEGARADTSPSGTAAIVDLLGHFSISVHRLTEPPARLDGGRTLVVLPGAEVDDAAWPRLLAWVRDEGGRLVVAGPRALPDEIGVRIEEGGSTATRVRAPGDDATFGGLTLAVPGEGLELVPNAPEGTFPAGTFLVRGEGRSAYAASRALGEGRVVVLADDRLFTNIALAVADDGAFLVQLFRWMPAAASGPVEVDLWDGWTGAGATTPIASVRHAGLTPVVAQLFVLLALLFLWRGAPFARLRDPPARTRRAFADHARALGVAYGRARASRHVLGLYAAWAFERLRERVLRGGRRGLSPLAEAIAARTGRPEAEVMTVLVTAHDAREEAAPPSSLRAPSGTGVGGKRARARNQEAEDLAILRALSGYLAATGKDNPRSTTDPEGRA